MDPRYIEERSALKPDVARSGRQGDDLTAGISGSGGLGAFGYSLTQDTATSKWMKMISSTFLGDSSGSIFSRRSPAIAGNTDAAASFPTKKRGKHGVDATPELKIALVGGPGVVR